jgi:hypothetical protein
MRNLDRRHIAGCHNHTHAQPGHIEQVGGEVEG